MNVLNLLLCPLCGWWAPATMRDEVGDLAHTGKIDRCPRCASEDRYSPLAQRRLLADG